MSVPRYTYFLRRRSTISSIFDMSEVTERTSVVRLSTTSRHTFDAASHLLHFFPFACIPLWHSSMYFRSFFSTWSQKSRNIIPQVVWVVFVFVRISHLSSRPSRRHMNGWHSFRGTESCRSTVASLPLFIRLTMSMEISSVSWIVTVIVQKVAVQINLKQ